MPVASFLTTIAPLAVAVGIVGALVTLASAVWGVKWKSAAEGSAATNAALQTLAAAAKEYGDLMKIERDLMKGERDKLRSKLDEVASQLGEAHKTIARLEALPNLEAVLKLMSQTYEKIEEQQKGRYNELREVQAEILDEVRAIRAA